MTPAISNTEELTHCGELLIDANGAVGTVLLRQGQRYAVRWPSGQGLVSADDYALYRENYLKSLPKADSTIKIMVCPHCGCCMDDRRSTMAMGELSPSDYTANATDDMHQQGFVFDIADEQCSDCNNQFMADVLLDRDEILDLEF